jgi:hypothetical protein
VKKTKTDANATCEFRVQWDARRESYVTRDKTGELISHDRNINVEITKAVNTAKLANKNGKQVKVSAENDSGVWRTCYAADAAIAPND